MFPRFVAAAGSNGSGRLCANPATICNGNSVPTSLEERIIVPSGFEHAIPIDNVEILARVIVVGTAAMVFNSEIAQEYRQSRQQSSRSG